MARLTVGEGIEEATAAAARWLGELATAGARGFALAGGHTPIRLYQRLVDEPWRSQIPWTALDLFLGDERDVPSDHPDSNYRMVKEVLLDALPSGRRPRLHRWPTEQPADTVLAEYEARLASALPVVEGFPVLDGVLLGMGADGHTASLFPGSPALAERQRWVSHVFVPGLQSWRYTLTLPVLRRARHVAFLVTGSAKAEALARVWQAEPVGTGDDIPPAAAASLPAALVNRADAEWFVDRAAVARLQP